MMKKILYLLTFISLYQISYGQSPCDFDVYKRKNYNWIEHSENSFTNYFNSNSSNRLNDTIRIIPVVVHVIHLGGSENISDAQIQSQIDILNEDYRKITGTNGDGNGVDTKIQFCLAKKNPEGKCSNGIVRINSSLSNHQTYQRAQLKQLSFWDNSRYLNIYVVKSINGSSGTLGYSSFPGGPADEDGIVVRHNYFGNIGTASSSLGRTTTHEVGHWLGLYHTFNNGCGIDVCTDGDYVCDTPPAAAPNFGCPTSVNSCSNDNPDLPDLIANYMDYSNDNCKSMFTLGQKDRMHASLNNFRNDIWQQWNLDSTGCDSNYVSPTCNVIADFTSNSQNICINNSVQFINKSLNNPLTYQWYFPGGTPSTSTQQNPTIIYNSIGTFDAILKVTGSMGSDSIFMGNYISVTTPPIGQSLPFSEDFESLNWPPTAITIDNPDGGVTWELDTNAAYAGIASAKIDNLINTNYGTSDALIFPAFDLSTFGSSPYLNYKWAYAKSDPNYSDEMIVLVSTDCGVNFTQVFYRTGTALTTGPTQTTPYIPDSTTTWKSANISLAAYASATNVIIKIVNVTDGGNNLYIDHINIGINTIDVSEIIEENNYFNVFPNPTTGIINITSLNSNSSIDKFQLISITGKVIETFTPTKIGDSYQINLPAVLENGIYNLVIYSTDQKFYKKIILID